MTQRFSITSLILIVALAAALPLSAQNPDEETFVARPAPRGRQPEPLVRSYTIATTMKSSFLGFNNGDLTALDESSYLSARQTDDRLFVGFSDLSVNFKADILGIINFESELSFGGFWGNDSLSYGSGSKNLYARYLNFTLDLAESLLGTSSLDLDLKVGRQRFRMADTDRHRNYIMRDDIDAIVFSGFLPDANIGGAIFADFFAMNSPTDDVYSLKSDRHDYTVPHFDGDVNIIRYGLVTQFKLTDEYGFLQNLDAKFFALFSRIGATGKNDYHSGGYEQSGMGYEGNYPDNDWLGIIGTDILVDTSLFSLLLEFGYSRGKDRRAKGFPDVDISGILFHASLDMDLSFINVGGSLLYVSGASTDEHGNYLNYGFVSFKADRLGGFLFSKYYGIYPSGVLNYSGIDFDPVRAARRAPVFAVSGRGGIKRMSLTGEANTGLSALFEGWLYVDTSSTSMDTDLPLESHIYDQRRLGNYMGLELNVDISLVIRREVLETGLKIGYFIPGDFFFFPASLSSTPYGTDIFRGFELYTTLRF